MDAFDVVFTWVDDSWPGYLDQLNSYASDRRDLNPNRTRDNLQLLRYAMRSVAQHMPQARRIYLFTARPQVPAWLDSAHPKIHLAHHDAVIAPQHLPTFSSFAIVSHLHKLPGLAPRFVYMEDDFLLNSSAVLGVLQDGERPQVHLGQHWIAPWDKLNPATSSPWNLALANMDRVLSAKYSPGPRRQVIHGPQLFDQAIFAAAEASFPEVFEATRAAKFRSAQAVPPENFVPHFAVEAGLATLAPRALSQRVEGYVSLENITPWTWAQLKRLDLRAPMSIALNDSFGARPNPRVERLVRRWLQAKFPKPGPWEVSA
jgi:hypothetical protein